MFKNKNFAIRSLLSLTIAIASVIGFIGLGTTEACAQGNCRAGEIWCCKPTPSGGMACSCQMLFW
jgi:hypothetical protein